MISISCREADEYWSLHPELQDIPIYYASSLAKKCMAVYQTYVNAMNDRIRRQIAVNNPFIFRHISNLKVGPFNSPPLDLLPRGGSIEQPTTGSPTSRWVR
ncbi:unnamed protein product, partial [Iphiclides podalirius]